MAWRARPDGDPVRNVAPMRRIMPHIMPTRAGASVYYEQRLDLGAALPWLATQSALAGKRIGLFHLVQYALLQVMHRRPDMHRFVAGGALYQRKHIEFSYTVKKQLTDEGALTTVKTRFAPTDTFADVVAKVDGATAQGRGTALLPAETELKYLMWLPNRVLGWLVRLQAWLDGWNLLPAAMTASDPLYASAFLANLGSVGLDAPFHHLYEWGTVPIFVAVGKVTQPADGAATVLVRFTFDERIADGLYCSKSLEILREIVERPDLHVR